MKISISCWINAFLLATAFLFSTHFDAEAQTRGGNNPTIVRTGYDFAPTVMRDVDGLYKTWWCSGNILQNPQQIDYIRYSTATSMAGPWSTPQVVFKGSNLSGKFDADSACSPSVIRVNGTYYMYYEGADFYVVSGVQHVVGGTKIGVASSSNGINWTRLNNGNPIAIPYNYPSGNSLSYGAGYPNVSYVDGKFYMTYFDSTGFDQTKRAYIFRSTSPLFTASTTEQLGSTGFVPHNASTRTHYGIRDVIYADITYHHGLKEFMIGITGVGGLIHTAFFDSNFQNELRLTSVPATWSQGAGFYRDTHGNFPKSLPDIGYHFTGNSYQSSCYVPIDFLRSIGDPSQDLGDLAYVGYNYIAPKRCGDVAESYIGDFDGDFIADQAIYRPSNGVHYRNSTTTGVNLTTLSNPTAIPIKGDFDGDSKGDFGMVYTDGNGALWWVIIKSSNGAVRIQPTWGFGTDKIAIADYNGDGKDDFAIFRNGDWWVIYDNNTYFTASWGQAGDIPVAADYDGDGVDELGVYRPSNGTWYIKDQVTNVIRSQQWGLNGDIPIPADYMADGKMDFAVWRPSDGSWYLRDNVTGAIEVTQFGLNGDVPVAEDFNGDGKVDLSVWRNGTGWWYHNFRNGRVTGNQFGSPGDLIHRVR